MQKSLSEMTKSEILHKLLVVDSKILSFECEIKRLEETRRELINRYDINKPNRNSVC